ncbi:unnamed protein product, partial [Musa hybrid cultivar]
QTEGRSIHGLNAIDVVLAASHDCLPWSITIHEHVHLVLGDEDILLVDPGLDVDHIAACILLGHGIEGSVDSLIVSTPILSHHHVRLQLTSRTGSQELPVMGREPRGITLGIAPLRQ